LNIQQPTADYGVIVGRFQVSQLTAAHHDLIAGVLQRHRQVLVIVGCTPGNLTNKANPLSYAARTIMLRDSFPLILTEGLQDMPSDEDWSREMDKIIRRVFPMGSVLLYGGRDSFIPHYHGNFPTAEVSTVVSLSGTEQRNQIRTQVPTTTEGRAGVIFAIENQYSSFKPCVDILCYNPATKEILLAKRNSEPGWRMPGGHADIEKDNSYDDAAKREFYEEMGHTIEADNFQMLFSFKVDDPRYRTSSDKIMTLVFSAQYVHGFPRASDDIDEAKWFPIGQLPNLMPEHKNAIAQACHKILTQK